MTKMQPLHDEHKELWPRVEKLLSTAETVGSTDVTTLRLSLDELLEFLNRHLIPHASAEDHVLYPTVQRIMGAPQATATMSRDHVEVACYIAELTESIQTLPRRGDPSVVETKAVRRILYGLYALLKVHFAKEEEIYLPLLEEHLTEPEAVALFAEMEHAAGQARDKGAHAA